MICLLNTFSPYQPCAWHAFWLAEELKKQDKAFAVFFYQDAVNIAHAISLENSDHSRLQQSWQSLDVDLPICVTAAIQRGITDEIHAKRHHFFKAPMDQTPHNLAEGFRLTGLGELAELPAKTNKLIQL